MADQQQQQQQQQQQEQKSSTPVKESKGWWAASCIIPGRLEGKLAIVTGANTGIGEVTAAELARRGCTVIMACRSMERAQAAKDRIINKYGKTNPDCLKVDVADEGVVSSLSPVEPNQLILEQLDLGSFQSVRDFAQRVNAAHAKIDYLINNAGLALAKYEKSEDGLEKTIAVNHLGPFLLTNLLLPAVKRAAPSRIITVASLAQKYGTLHKPDLQFPESSYNIYTAYRQSKLANVMFARELARRLEGTNVTSVSLHPGLIKTDFFRDFTSFRLRMQYAMYKPFAITPWQGAQTTMYTILTDKLVPGAYYSNCAVATPKRLALNDAECEWLWKKSCELVGIQEGSEEHH